MIRRIFSALLFTLFSSLETVLAMTPEETFLLIQESGAIQSKRNEILELIKGARFETDVAAANDCYSKYREFLSTASDWIRKSPDLEFDFYRANKIICEQLLEFSGIPGINFNPMQETFLIDQLMKRAEPMYKFYCDIHFAAYGKEIKRAREMETARIREEVLSGDLNCGVERETPSRSGRSDDSSYKMIAEEEAKLFHLVMEAGRRGITLDESQREEILSIVKKLQLGAKLEQLDSEYIHSVGLSSADLSSYKTVRIES
ncbi:MAG: hypothetical protein LBO02_01885 [Holosporaceae bacterium]|nr:hypothetical protein [Holosporaceae bacterium]